MSALFTSLDEGLVNVAQVPENAVVLIGTESGWGSTTMAALRTRLLGAINSRVEVLEQAAAKWVLINALTTMTPNTRYLADARNGSFELHFPETLETGQSFEVSVVGGSVQLRTDDYMLLGSDVTTLVSGRVYTFVALDLVTIVSIP